MTVIWKSKVQPARHSRNRPYVILSAAMTLDGKIATRTGDTKISGLEDLLQVYKLRASVDAIMVGIGTILADNPLLTAHSQGNNPRRIIVDSKARTPLTARVLTEKTDKPTIVAVTEKAPKRSIEKLRSAGAEVVIAGSGNKVNLRSLMKMLWNRKIETLMVEGGGTIIWSLLEQGLVDKIRVAISPKMVGGSDAVTLVEGKGFSEVEKGIKLNLNVIEKFGRDLVLTYQVLARDVIDSSIRESNTHTQRVREGE